MAVMRGVRRMHSLPDGYMTPEHNVRFKSKEEQAADRAALESKLHDRLQEQMQLPPVRDQSQDASRFSCVVCSGLSS